MNHDDVQAILAATTDDRIRVPAEAWLRAFRHARWLSFNETVALSQADAAWDRAAQDQAATVEAAHA